MVNVELKKAAKLISGLQSDLLIVDSPEDFSDAVDFLKQAREVINLADESIKHANALRRSPGSSLIGYPQR